MSIRPRGKLRMHLHSDAWSIASDVEHFLRFDGLLLLRWGKQLLDPMGAVGSLDSVKQVTQDRQDLGTVPRIRGPPP